MNDDRFTLISEITSNGTKEGFLEEVKIMFDKLSAQGYKDFKIKIYGDALKAAEINGIDKNVFSCIKEKQSLPENVVFNLFSAKSVLAGNNLIERISFDW